MCLGKGQALIDSSHKRNRPPPGWCESEMDGSPCMYYQDREIISHTMFATFGNPVEWDEKMCWFTCYRRDLRKKKGVNNVASNRQA